MKLLLTLLAMLLTGSDALACAACFGKSDSAMAQGMNMGILSLIGVIVPVLMTIAGFFFYLARRAAKYSATPQGPSANSNSGLLLK